MKENYRFINQLQNCRYGITSPYNDTQVSVNLVTASPTWERVLNISYLELAEKLQQHFSGTATEHGDDVSARGTQQYRNHVSTLNSYLAFVGKTLESRVGIELGSSFDVSVRQYLELLDVAPRTKRDRRSHLQLIRRLFEETKSQLTQPAKPPSSLSVELRSAIAKHGMAPKAMAKKIGMSPSVVAMWLRGGTANKRGIPSLRRLETELGMKRDTLVSLVQTNAVTSRTPGVAPVVYRERVKQLRKESCTLTESTLTNEFKQEWRALFEYKTGTYTHLDRQSKGRWRLIPESTTKKMSPLAQKGKLVCPSAAINLAKVLNFMGVVLQLPVEQGGLLESDDTQLQTLAWLAHPRALLAYLDWMTQRSDGIKHRGQGVFSATVAALVRPQTGYLWQQPAFRMKLPGEFRPETDEAWQKMCAQSHKLLREYVKQSTGVSRDPQEPIAGILEAENGLSPILRAIEQIEADAAAASPGSVTEALLRRDALLLSLLLSNPLRIRVFMSMTWLANGTGMLRGSSTAGWRIHLEKHHLKNGESLATRDYDVRIASWVKPRLDAYLEEYRGTILAGQNSSFLFVSSRGNGGMWESMESHVRKLTQRYIPGSPGFGPHAFRHIVATDWLARNPNDFLTVAELLNDRIETVIAHYAHLKRDTSFLRYEEHVETLMK